MGDDLIFAQKFTRTAADGLSLLAQMDDPRTDTDAPVVIDMMTRLQRGAKRLRARHIYTGAQGVLSALHHAPDEILTSRIEALGSLVTQYARGLEDLLSHAPNVAVPQVHTAQNQTARYTAARAELDALLPIATPQDADLLSRLMRAPVTIDDLRPDEASPFEADILPFAARETVDASELDLIDDTADAPNDATAALSPVFDLPAEPDLPMIQLDALMRDVVADALSVARTAGRTISLSYDMGERAVDLTRAENLRARLGSALSQIIRQSLPEDRVGHIDVNLAGEQLHVVTGTTALRVALDPKAAPTRKPLITSETEHGLRAQLAALMDPAALSENWQDTAS